MENRKTNEDSQRMNDVYSNYSIFDFETVLIHSFLAKNYSLARINFEISKLVVLDLRQPNTHLSVANFD